MKFGIWPILSSADWHHTGFGLYTVVHFHFLFNTEGFQLYNCLKCSKEKPSLQNMLKSHHFKFNLITTSTAEKLQYS